MQEEVEKKSVNLAVTTTKVSARILMKALRSYVNHLKNKSAKKAVKKDENIKGEQRVKELIGHGQGVSSMDVGDSGIRDFKRIANKYGVDFAIVKDKDATPPKYTCFFKAKDADAILKVMDEYTKKQVKKKNKVKRPSVLEKLKKFKDIVAKTPRKEKEKKKEQER